MFKKCFWFGWGVRLGEARKVGVFLFFWPTLTGPGRQSNEPKFWLKRFLKTRWSPASIELLLDLLACLEPKLWPKKNILPPKSAFSDSQEQDNSGKRIVFLPLPYFSRTSIDIHGWQRWRSACCIYWAFQRAELNCAAGWYLANIWKCMPFGDRINEDHTNLVTLMTWYMKHMIHQGAGL